MAEYELVYEIKNLCRNNQMRDVFFEEVECDDPEEYLRGDSAQLMIVVGTNYDTWEENLSLALKLHAQLETACPGITRPLQLRGQRFNEDLSPGGVLIEVGAAGNSHDEALTAAGELAKAIIALAKGTQPLDEE